MREYVWHVTEFEYIMAWLCISSVYFLLFYYVYDSFYRSTPSHFLSSAASDLRGRSDKKSRRLSPPPPPLCSAHFFLMKRKAVLFKAGRHHQGFLGVKTMLNLHDFGKWWVCREIWISCTNGWQFSSDSNSTNVSNCFLAEPQIHQGSEHPNSLQNLWWNHKRTFFEVFNAYKPYNKPYLLQPKRACEINLWGH